MSFLKKEVKNAKSVFLGMLALVLVIIFSVVTTVKYRNEIWPTKDYLFNQKRTYRRLRADLKKAQELHRQFELEKTIVANKIKTFYRTDGKVKADLYLRQRIEHAAKFASLVLKSMSSVRKKKITQGTFSLELSISAEGEFEKVISFLQELDKKETEIYWVSCYLRPTHKKKETSINISGVLRILCTDGKLFKNKAKAGIGGKKG